MLPYTISDFVSVPCWFVVEETGANGGLRVSVNPELACLVLYSRNSATHLIAKYRQSKNRSSSSSPFVFKNKKELKMVRVSVLVSRLTFFPDWKHLISCRMTAWTTLSTPNVVESVRCSSDLHPKSLSNSSVSCNDMVSNLNNFHASV